MASKPTSESKGNTGTSEPAEGDSSESDGETEPAKSFHRRISTNKEIKCSLSIKEGYLMKQTSSFQRWRRRYFKIKGRKLYYSKDTKSVIFDEIDLRDLSVAECGTKNINHSWQCITPFRVLVLAAESRKEMESWIAALKSAAKNQYYEGMDQIHTLLSGQHNWYATSHARPTYCNICREALSGVTSHGLSCEVCKLKSHKRCAAKAVNNCKWTTLSSVGKEIIEDDDGLLAMPHQWMEGNLPVSAKCSVCDKNCGSVRRLQDWRCLWCKATVHTACRPLYAVRCPLGPCRVSIVPPTALTTIGNDETWEAIRPQGCSPLLVFVNSKSGENQGVRFLRRFKQLLNPAQVFDLVNGGPVLGLRLFKCFYPFRILICSGDGSVGWVLSEIDKLNMTNQCQIGVLPLGTGNDLARVLGWGSACDDDAHLPHLIEKYERATTKMLDRWSVMTYVSHVALRDVEESKIGATDTTPENLLTQVAEFEDSVATHLSSLLQSEEDSVVVSSAKILCETVKSLILKVGSSSESIESGSQSPDSLSTKCLVLNNKLDMLLETLQQESKALSSFPGLISLPPIAVQEESVVEESSEASTDMESFGRMSSDRDERFTAAAFRKKTRQRHFLEKEALMSRANSLKKAVRQIIEHAENQIDEQNRRLHNLPEIRLEFAEDEQTLASSSSQSGTTYSTPFLSSITTTFPLPPASPLPHARNASVTAATLAGSLLQIPDQSLHAKASSETGVSPHAISPLPDVRRSSHEFDFPTTLPVPSEFADLKHRLSISSQCTDDVEVHIQSSTDNLVDVDDEPSMFEEKSISDIRDSLATSLNTSIDIDDLDDEELDNRGERGTPDGGFKDESAAAKPSGSDENGTTEKDSGDSEDTDDTVKEKGSPDEYPSGAEISDEIAPHQIEISVPVLADPVVLKVDAPPVLETSLDNIVINVPVSEGPPASPIFLEVPTDPRNLLEVPSDSSEASLPSERIVEGAEASSDSERGALGFLAAFSPATRRVSTGAALKLGGQNISLDTPSGSSSRDKSRSPERSGRVTGGSVSRAARRNLPIINPLVSLPMWPNITSGGSSGGLISKVLLANADALCAAASPLMDLDDSSLEGYNERCIMNNYFGIGIDAKITLDFHNKREEHPEKCRSRTKNFMWYGVLASKEWLCKTYKNFDQRVQLECDGERIPLPSLQGIVVLNIPSFMGGTNFWGGKKEDDSFLAPSFDDRILEVVAVFGSAQMAASRIINLQHHRIAQCSSIKITVLGEEGVPVQVDGEAWTQPPGIIRIVHKNRVQMLCRSRELEVSLKAWEEKQHSLGRHIKQLSLLSDEEIHCLDAMARMSFELLKAVRLAAATTPALESILTELSSTTQACLDKVWRDCRVIEGPNLRMLATEFVHGLQSLHSDMQEYLKDGKLTATASQEDNLRTHLLHVESELKKAHEMDHVMHFEEEAVPPPHERKRSLSKGALFKLKLKREALRGRGGLEGQVREWGLDEVAAWLDKLDLSEHKEAFISNDIRGAELLSLERRDLKELGVTKIGHIKRFQQAVKEIRENKAHVI